MTLSDRHFERKREIFVIRGQTTDVRKCSNGKPVISDLRASPYLYSAALRETLIKSLSDLALVFSCKARNKPPRIASYVRRVMTKHWMKIHAKSGSAIESAFP